MLVDVHVERKSAALREFEQEVEECQRLIGILRAPRRWRRRRRRSRRRAIASTHRACAARRWSDEPRPAGSCALGSAHAAAPSPRRRAARSAIRYWCGFGSQPCRARGRCRAVRSARAMMSARGDRCGEVAVAGRGAFQRRARIGDHAPCARFVEMLMGVDEPGNDELAGQVDHLAHRARDRETGPARRCGRRGRCPHRAVPADRRRLAAHDHRSR